MAKRYIVPVVFRGQENFEVVAESPEEAKEKAEAAFKGGFAHILLGNEWHEVERIGKPEEYEGGPR